MSNMDLNKLDIYAHKKCAICGRSYPETTLNIEAAIHYGCKYLCCDVRTCKKTVKKNKKNQKKLDL